MMVLGPGSRVIAKLISTPSVEISPTSRSLPSRRGQQSSKTATIVPLPVSPRPESRCVFSRARMHFGTDDGNVGHACDFRTPADIRTPRGSSRSDLSAVQPGLDEDLIEPVVPYFRVEGTLRNPELPGNQGEATATARNRGADGSALDRFQIGHRRGRCQDGELRARFGDRGSDLLRK